VLTGRITQRGDDLTISAELVDVRNSKLLWGEQYDRKASDLLATQREIAERDRRPIKATRFRPKKGLVKHYTENNEAYELYLKGRFYWNKRTSEANLKAVEAFQQAIEKDPTFALAYSGLADDYILMGTQDAGGTLPPEDAFPKPKPQRSSPLKLIAHLPNHTCRSRTFPTITILIARKLNASSSER
jgi:hypothetical protein